MRWCDGACSLAFQNPRQAKSSHTDSLPNNSEQSSSLQVGSGAFEIGIGETPPRLSSLEPHQVIHTVGETTKLAPSATPQSSPTNLVSSWRRLGNLYGSFRPHHLSGESH